MGCPHEPITAPAQGAGPPDGPTPLLTENLPEQESKALLFHSNWVFPTSNKSQLFLNIDLSRDQYCTS